VQQWREDNETTNKKETIRNCLTLLENQSVLLHLEELDKKYQQHQQSQQPPSPFSKKRKADDDGIIESSLACPAAAAATLPARWRKTSYPLEIHLIVLLLNNQLSWAVEIVGRMERMDMSIIDDDSKFAVWKRIFEYLLQNGKLYLDQYHCLDDSSSEYRANRSFLLFSVVPKLGICGKATLVEFHKTVLETVWANPQSTLEEKRYLLLATQKTLLKCFSMIGMVDDGVTEYLRITWPVDHSNVAGTMTGYNGNSSLFPPPPPLVATTGALATAEPPKELVPWILRFQMVENPIPDSLLDDGTMESPNLMRLLLPEALSSSPQLLPDAVAEIEAEEPPPMEKADDKPTDSYPLLEDGETSEIEVQDSEEGDDAIIVLDDDDDNAIVDGSELQPYVRDGENLDEMEDEEEEEDYDDEVEAEEEEEEEGQGLEDDYDDEIQVLEVDLDSSVDERQDDQDVDESQSEPDDEGEEASSVEEVVEMLDSSSDGGVPGGSENSSEEESEGDYPSGREEDEEDEDRIDEEDEGHIPGDSPGGRARVAGYDSSDDQSSVNDSIERGSEDDGAPNREKSGEAEVVAARRDYGDTTEEDDNDDGEGRGMANQTALANREADVRAGAKQGYSSQLEEGYEPEDSQAYTEEEVSEAIHTEDEEEERRQQSLLKDSKNNRENPLPDPQIVRQADVQDNDMDADDDHTEEEIDLEAESSELEEAPGGPHPNPEQENIGSAVMPDDRPDPISLVEFAQSAARKHESPYRQSILPESLPVEGSTNDAPNENDIVVEPSERQQEDEADADAEVDLSLPADENTPTLPTPSEGIDNEENEPGTELPNEMTKQDEVEESDNEVNELEMEPTSGTPKQGEIVAANSAEDEMPEQDPGSSEPEGDDQPDPISLVESAKSADLKNVSPYRQSRQPDHLPAEELTNDAPNDDEVFAEPSEWQQEDEADADADAEVGLPLPADENTPILPSPSEETNNEENEPGTELPSAMTNQNEVEESDNEVNELETEPTSGTPKKGEIVATHSAEDEMPEQEPGSSEPEDDEFLPNIESQPDIVGTASHLVGYEGEAGDRDAISIAEPTEDGGNEVESVAVEDAATGGPFDQDWTNDAKIKGENKGTASTMEEFLDGATGDVSADMEVDEIHITSYEGLEDEINLPQETVVVWNAAMRDVVMEPQADDTKIYGENTGTVSTLEEFLDDATGDVSAAPMEVDETLIGCDEDVEDEINQPQEMEEVSNAGMGDVEMGKEEEEPEKPQEIDVIANKGVEVVEAEALAQENEVATKEKETKETLHDEDEAVASAGTRPRKTGRGKKVKLGETSESSKARPTKRTTRGRKNQKMESDSESLDDDDDDDDATVEVAEKTTKKGKEVSDEAEGHEVKDDHEDESVASTGNMPRRTTLGKKVEVDKASVTSKASSTTRTTRGKKEQQGESDSASMDNNYFEDESLASTGNRPRRTARGKKSEVYEASVASKASSTIRTTRGKKKQKVEGNAEVDEHVDHKSGDEDVANNITSRKSARKRVENVRLKDFVPAATKLERGEDQEDEELASGGSRPTKTTKGKRADIDEASVASKTILTKRTTLRKKKGKGESDSESLDKNDHEDESIASTGNMPRRTTRGKNVEVNKASVTSKASSTTRTTRGKKKQKSESDSDSMDKNYHEDESIASTGNIPRRTTRGKRAEVDEASVASKASSTPRTTRGKKKETVEPDAPSLDENDHENESLAPAGNRPRKTTRGKKVEVDKASVISKTSATTRTTRGKKKENVGPDFSESEDEDATVELEKKSPKKGSGAAVATRLQRSKPSQSDTSDDDQSVSTTGSRIATRSSGRKKIGAVLETMELDPVAEESDMESPKGDPKKTVKPEAPPKRKGRPRKNK
jgi:trimeric autotransporter adhesin